jgi:hypothetical protein
LAKYGNNMNETHFEILSFQQVNNQFVGIQQLSFSIEVACCVSIILMLGLAYSLARDNETQVSKNICYIPVGVNKYLLSKTIPYILLGILELTVMYGLGYICFDIKYEINIFLIVLLSIFFIASVVALGLIFSLLKSQIATIFLDMLSILLPLFITLLSLTNYCSSSFTKSIFKRNF